MTVTVGVTGSLNRVFLSLGAIQHIKALAPSVEFVAATTDPRLVDFLQSSYLFTRVIISEDSDYLLDVSREDEDRYATELGIEKTADMHRILQDKTIEFPKSHIGFGGTLAYSLRDYLVINDVRLVDSVDISVVGPFVPMKRGYLNDWKRKLRVEYGWRTHEQVTLLEIEDEDTGDLLSNSLSEFGGPYGPYTGFHFLLPTAKQVLDDDLLFYTSLLPMGICVIGETWAPMAGASIGKASVDIGTSESRVWEATVKPLNLILWQSGHPLAALPGALAPYLKGV